MQALGTVWMRLGEAHSSVEAAPPPHLGLGAGCVVHELNVPLTHA